VKHKKVPMRMCLGCKEMKPKKELIRIVRTVQGDIIIDVTGKKSGRGAYVCKNDTCIDSAVKAERLSKALDIKVNNETAFRIKEDINKI